MVKKLAVCNRKTVEENSYFPYHRHFPFRLFCRQEILCRFAVFIHSKPLKTMIITTTSTLEGHRITKYLGVVTGEAIVGVNAFKDMFAGITDVIGGRSGTYERELGRARELAFEEMEELAVRLGANAIVGVDLDYEVLGEKNGMMMVSVNGTAVIVQ